MWHSINIEHKGANIMKYKVEKQIEESIKEYRESGNDLSNIPADVAELLTPDLFCDLIEYLKEIPEIGHTSISELNGNEDMTVLDLLKLDVYEYIFTIANEKI